ncbi:MAG: RNA methyltransferase [Acidobacteriaceae bacterium]
MLSSLRSRLRVVLVGARNPFNIGAAARAMQDFGFCHLRVVNDFSPPFEAAQLEAEQQTEPANLSVPLDPFAPTPAAVAAQQVLRSARRYDTLLEAIADCTFTVGTTAIGERRLRQPILRLEHAAPLMLAALHGSSACGAAAEQQPGREKEAQEQSAGEPRVALLFGSEKTGLTNEHLSHCDLLTTIPMFQPEGNRHLSMNLGQSVAVCLYELTRSGFEHSVELPRQEDAPATVQDRERLTQLLLQVLTVTGYTRRFPGNAREPVVRQLVLQLAAASAPPESPFRHGITHVQAMTVMGILRRVLQHIPAAPQDLEEASQVGSIE